MGRVAEGPVMVSGALSTSSAAAGPHSVFLTLKKAGWPQRQICSLLKDVVFD